MSVAVGKERIPDFILHTYGLRVIKTPDDLPQGVHSTAWLIHSDDGDWVVKISNPASDPPNELAMQCAVYEFLNDRGLHAPLVLADRDGRRVSSVEGSDGIHYPVTMMRHHRLRRLTAESITDSDLYRVASQVGRLHTVMESFPDRSVIINNRRKSLSEWGKQDAGCYRELIQSPTGCYFTGAERSWIETIDTAVMDYVDAGYPEPTSLSCAVLHGDLAFEQVRLLPAGEVYFFDFGDLSWGPVAHELAQFLRGFTAEPISGQRWLDLRAGLLAGYRSGHSFSAADEDAIDVFLLNRVVALARYVLELQGDNASPVAAEIIKQSYRLAAEMLQGSHQSKQL